MTDSQARLRSASKRIDTAMADVEAAERACQDSGKPVDAFSDIHALLQRAFWEIQVEQKK